MKWILACFLMAGSCFAQTVKKTGEELTYATTDFAPLSVFQPYSEQCDGWPFIYDPQTGRCGALITLSGTYGRMTCVRRDEDTYYCYFPLHPLEPTEPQLTQLIEARHD